jgi:hypothetical protein
MYILEIVKELSKICSNSSEFYQKLSNLLPFTTNEKEKSVII